MDNKIQAIKAAYPDVDWNKFFEADRALNWELWHGPLPSNYWIEVEPLEHYEWKGFLQAVKDIQEMLSSIPHEVYWDCDGDWFAETNPDNIDDYWEEFVDGEWVYTGPDFELIEPAKILMHKETHSAIF